MRLVNTSTIQLEEFEGDSAPQYAILSHRWQEEEVTYKDMELGRARAKKKKGYSKLTQSCSKAAELGHGYIWIDACCIDKSSSAELSEAINSMFRWYQQATVCIAYLYDVPDIAWSNSEWFSRGWTLQELIAPRIVLFFDSRWALVGRKQELDKDLSVTTAVPQNILNDATQLEKQPVAVRMSWAANRKTTRVEDRVYSLMGLFNVNMPMLYGEGEKAFLRLQQEIIKQSDDTTVLMWNTHDQWPTFSPFARSPNDFAFLRHSSTVVSDMQLGRMLRLGRSSFTLTNIGLSIELQLLPFQDCLYLALLPDTMEGSLFFGRKRLKCIKFLVLAPNRRTDTFSKVQLNQSYLYELRGTVVRSDGKRPYTYLEQVLLQEDDGTGRFPGQPYDYAHDFIRKRVTISPDSVRLYTEDSLGHGVHLMIQGDIKLEFEGHNGRSSIAGHFNTVSFLSDPGVKHIFGAVHTKIPFGDGFFSMYLAFDEDFNHVLIVTASTELKTLFRNKGSSRLPLKSIFPGSAKEYCVPRGSSEMSMLHIAHETFSVEANERTADLGGRRVPVLTFHRLKITS